MNRYCRHFVLLLGLTINMPALPAAESAVADDPLWTEVDRAIAQRQPQTALERLEPIAERAKRQDDLAEQARVIATRIELELATTDRPADEPLRRMRAAIEGAEGQLQGLLEAIHASWMWQFFQQHRWRFARRSAVAAEPQVSDDPPLLPGPGDQMLSWDLPHILRAVDGQFARSLAAAETLQSVPVDDFKKVLRIGNVPSEYRPTMYDILVHHALEFYSSGQQAGSQAIDAFDLWADSPVFARRDEYLAWTPASPDVRAPLRVAVGLYQDLIRFHRDGDRITALLDADLGRLRFGFNHAVGDEKSARYEAALKRFINDHSDHPIAAQAQADLAELALEDDDPARAHEIASEVVARLPQSIGGRRCHNLIQRIEAPESEVMTERVWNAPWPTIDVRYRNIETMHFRLVPMDFQRFLRSQRWQPEAMDDAKRRQVLAAEPMRQWSAALPPTSDYRRRLESLAIPEDLPAGPYYLLSSRDAGFRETDNDVGVSEVWISKLALVTRSQSGSGRLGGHVMDAQSGEPISGAVVRAWQRPRGRGLLTPLNPVRTDAEGRFEFPPANRNQVVMLVTHGDQQLASPGFLNTTLREQPGRVRQQTQLFTDRAIYRPGQTVRYKGICFSQDQQNDDYQTLDRQNVTIVLLDANGKEVQRQQHRSNDYGSFSGSFTAPRDRLTGRMTIRVASGPQGHASITIEEYKRPKFEVQLKSPQPAASLGQQVQMNGKATAYTGATIDGAEVRWRVVREVRYPPWWFWRRWWMPPPQQESQEIARGTASTDADGAFPIAFVAKPDPAVSPESEPTFRFTIYADVTDGTGETRSDRRTVNLGFTSLAATISADDWQTTDQPIELTLQTTDLDGEPQAASGTLRVHALEQPEQVAPARLRHGGGPPIPLPDPRQTTDQDAPPPDPADPNSWPLGDVVFESEFQTDGAGRQTLTVELPAGIYRAVLSSRDGQGKKVSAELPVNVFDLAARRWPVKQPHRLQFETTSIQPDQTLRAVWASGYSAARAHVKIEHRGEIIHQYWTPEPRTQAVIEVPVSEEMRGGFTVHTMMVRENRAYLESQRIDVPWSNKQLTIKWERFVSKLGPADEQTWTAVIQGEDAERAAAEMVATLYDASLDAFVRPHWPSGFAVFRQDRSRLSRGFANVPKTATALVHDRRLDLRDVDWRYTRLYVSPPGGFGDRDMPLRARRGEMMAMGGMDAPLAEGEPLAAADEAAADAQPADDHGKDDPPGVDLDLGGVPLRTNLNETAFFFPHVTADEDGLVKLRFTMPEALTRWQFFGFAHDRQLRGGLLADTAVTSKDLMVQPNPPRFLRAGDEVEFTLRVTNLSPTRQTGQAGLNFADARRGDSLDAALENTAGKLDFDIPAGGSQSLAWRIRVPDGITMMTYRAVASSGRLSDGEEGFLAVLPRQILLTESMPLPIRGRQTKQFDFQRLLDAGDAESIRHQSLTVQMTSNPSWYAVLALPYLMEFPHRCSEQVFNRLYANSLAHHIALADPRIEQVFEQWRGSEALDSPLQQNEEIKAIVLEETPWVRQGESESQARRHVGVLLDRNRLRDETSRALAELADQQLDDGRWPWFPGGPASDYITLYITTGFGRLKHLGVGVATAPAERALNALDDWMVRRHRQAIEADKQAPNADDKSRARLSHTMALYLYGRSFFVDRHPLAEAQQASLHYWLDQAQQHWSKLDSLQSHGHLAIALRRWGRRDAAQLIVDSLRQRAVTSDELGMYWPEARQAYWWYQAPVETQVTMIEVFDEIAGDAEAVEQCKVWLLKQKQTQAWKTTKATADAVYALLLRGTNLLASDALVEVTLGDVKLQPDEVEAGTGFYQQRKQGDQVRPDLGRITVSKGDSGVAWGSVHWQYFEDIDKVTAHSDTPLNISKELYVKRATDAGPQLVRLGQQGRAEASVGDELVVRLVLQVDRDMEFVHLKDHRGSGTEPVNVLSGYRHQDGLGYYESTRDTASHFFIDYLRRGTYVFEYSTRVQLRGRYQTGVANVQCMYAPEFNSHSQSIALEVGSGN